MKQNKTHWAPSILIVIAVASLVWVSAGNLDPPGPVGPTMKDLDDVEPRTAIRNDFVGLNPIVISSPGSYYLAEDITGFFDNHGIEIDASEVTLDLNGFTIYGNTEVGSFDGIHIANFRHNITIKDGTIRDFFQTGIRGNFADGCIVENVRVINSGGYGIRLQDNAIVRDCMILNNRDDGVWLGEQGIISGCIARDNGTLNNGDAGLRVNGEGGLITGSTSFSNTGSGLVVATGGLIVTSTARANSVQGINAALDGMVFGSTTTGNGGAAIVASSVHHTYSP